MDLQGVIPPVVTPLTGRPGEVDREALREFARWLVASGADGLFPCGTSGEFASLSRAERRAVIDTVAAAVDVPVLAGCGATSVGDALGLMEDAAEAGADAAVVVTPYYFSGTQAGLREFYEALLAEAPLPVVLYNIPGLAGARLEAATVGALAEREGAIALKDSTGDLAHLQRVLEATPAGFDVLQGATADALSALDLGVDGLVPGEGNALPGAFAEIVAAHGAGERDRAAAVFRERVMPVTGTITDMPTLPAIKHLVGLAGHDAGPPRPPLGELSEADRERLAAVYDRGERSNV
ncbi:MAG: dihydrodipicolinate synthase family protein [Halobacteriales archaeon]